ncbi:hypothetical protein, partial [Thiolapillus sp.]|uniref:hypothetical protein n=1 Tax=Thiolapillus sp. TaxID=2017437 RepID=UPI003AF46400
VLESDRLPDWLQRMKYNSEYQHILMLLESVKPRVYGWTLGGVHAAVYSYPSVDSSAFRETEYPIPVAVSRCRPRLFLMPVFGAILAQVFGGIPLKTSRNR